jgi:hypothetical protein
MQANAYAYACTGTHKKKHTKHAFNKKPDTGFHGEIHRDLVFENEGLVAGRFLVKKTRKHDEKYVFPSGYSLINGQM